MRGSILRFAALDARFVARLDGRSALLSKESLQIPRLRLHRRSAHIRHFQTSSARSRPQAAATAEFAGLDENALFTLSNKTAYEWNNFSAAGQSVYKGLGAEHYEAAIKRSYTPQQVLKALERKDPDQLLAVLINVSEKAQLPRLLTQTTWNEIFRALDPAHFLDGYRRVYEMVSPDHAAKIGIPPLSEVFQDYKWKVEMVIGLRREAEYPLGLPEYTFLLRVAQYIGDVRAAASLFDSMQMQGILPDATCYHHYMTTKCWSGIYSHHHRRSWRVTPYSRGAATATDPRRTVAGQVFGILKRMLRQGLEAEEKTFSLLMLAMARLGDIEGVESIVKSVWKADVQALLEDVGLKLEPIVDPSSTSPLRPTSVLLDALAQIYGSINNLPAALRLVDCFSKSYAIAVPPSVWAELLTWTFLHSLPRGRNRGTAGGSAEKLPVKAVEHLWLTMTGAPYNFAPSMPMYNMYIRNLFIREKLVLAQEQMLAGLALYRDGLRVLYKANKEFAAAEQAIYQEGPDTALPYPFQELRRNLVLKKWESRCHFLFLTRWVRLLLRVHPPDGRNYGWERREMPRIVEQWKAFMPTEIHYTTHSGTVSLVLDGVMEALHMTQKEAYIPLSHED